MNCFQVLDIFYRFQKLGFRKHLEYHVNPDVIKDFEIPGYVNFAGSQRLVNGTTGNIV